MHRPAANPGATPLPRRPQSRTPPPLPLSPQGLSPSKLQLCPPQRRALSPLVFVTHRVSPIAAMYDGVAHSRRSSFSGGTSPICSAIRAWIWAVMTSWSSPRSTISSPMRRKTSSSERSAARCAAGSSTVPKWVRQSWRAPSRSQPGDALPPAGRVQVRRRGRRADVVRPRDVDSPHIPRKGSAGRRVPEGQVVAGVPRGVQRRNHPPRHTHRLAILQRHHPLLGDPPHLSPQRLHPVPIDPPRAVHQPRRIDQMRRPHRMDEHPRPRRLIQQHPRRPRMVQMDMRHQNRRQIGRRKPRRLNPRPQRPQRRTRPRLDQRQLAIPRQQIRRDHLRRPLEPQIDLPQPLINRTATPTPPFSVIPTNPPSSTTPIQPPRRHCVPRPAFGVRPLAPPPRRHLAHGSG